MFLDEKSLLEIWLNPGLNLTIFRGTGPCRRLSSGNFRPLLIIRHDMKTSTRAQGSK